MCGRPAGWPSASTPRRPPPEQVHRGRAGGAGRCPAAPAEAYHVLPEEQFEPLAKEGVEACVSSLSAASAVVESPMDGRLRSSLGGGGV